MTKKEKEENAKIEAEWLKNFRSFLDTLEDELTKKGSRTKGDRKSVV